MEMPSRRTIDVVLLYNKSNMFGLAKDVQQFRTVISLAGMGYNVTERDPLEPPVRCEIAIHIEVPVGTMMPWASVNCLLVNPEWYSEEWDSYSDRIDYYFVRDSDSQKRLQARFPTKSVTCLPWSLPAPAAQITAHPESLRHSDGFAWFVGGSKNKRSAVQWLAPHWKATYPPLFVFSVDPIDLSGAVCAPNVTFRTGNVTVENKKKLTAYFPAQICVSEAEAFSYATAEAEEAGAFLLLNSLPVYKEKYTDTSFVSWIETPTTLDGLATRATFQATQDLEKQLDAAVQEFLATDLELCRKFQKEMAVRQRENCLKLWERGLDVWKELDEKAENTPVAKLPPVLLPEDCPPISVITLLYNRRRFFDLACHNIMLSDYPKDKIEWIVVEDSDDPNEDASDRVVQVGMQSAPLQLIYCPIGNKTPIAEKRNMGVARASNNIILFMDDDDHYPETSFRRRVAWLTKHPWAPKAVACTTIACYDLIRGVSAVNTPPFALGFSKRISEATLAFYKDFWTERNFNAADSVGEGEFFLQGRESQCLELPPQQMIVAFSHRKNTSGRRIPSDDAKPGCFWAFPREYLQYIHELAGVTVEEEVE